MDYFCSAFTKLREIEYFGTVANMCLNAKYAAALFDGKVQLHMVSHIYLCSVSISLLENSTQNIFMLVTLFDFEIDGSEQEERKQMKLFPDDDRKGRILCHALTADFLYYGTDVRLGNSQSTCSFIHVLMICI